MNKRTRNANNSSSRQTTLHGDARRLTTIYRREQGPLLGRRRFNSNCSVKFRDGHETISVPTSNGLAISAGGASSGRARREKKIQLSHHRLVLCLVCSAPGRNTPREMKRFNSRLEDSHQGRSTGTSRERETNEEFVIGTFKTATPNV